MASIQIRNTRRLHHVGARQRFVKQSKVPLGNNRALQLFKQILNPSVLNSTELDLEFVKAASTLQPGGGYTKGYLELLNLSGTTVNKSTLERWTGTDKDRTEPA